MRQHEREKKRALERVDELEQRKRELEGSIGAIENCWNQVRIEYFHVECLDDTLSHRLRFVMKQVYLLT